MLSILRDVVFPAQCAACNAIGVGLCSLCAPPSAPVVQRRLRTLDLVALGEYRDGLRRAVLAVKDGRRDVAIALGERLASIVPREALLVPVPTTRTRRRIRGIDGVALVTRTAAEHADAAVLAALVCRADDAQRGRTRHERLAARGRFRCEGSVLAGSHVVLVDDVCTTGTTLEDCADALRAAGGTVECAIVVAMA